MNYHYIIIGLCISVHALFCMKEESNLSKFLPSDENDQHYKTLATRSTSNKNALPKSFYTTREKSKTYNDTDYAIIIHRILFRTLVIQAYDTIQHNIEDGDSHPFLELVQRIQTGTIAESYDCFFTMTRRDAYYRLLSYIPTDTDGNAILNNNSVKLSYSHAMSNSDAKKYSWEARLIDKTEQSNSDKEFLKSVALTRYSRQQEISTYVCLDPNRDKYKRITTQYFQSEPKTLQKIVHPFTKKTSNRDYKRIKN